MATRKRAKGAVRRPKIPRPKIPPARLPWILLGALIGVVLTVSAGLALWPRPAKEPRAPVVAALPVRPPPAPPPTAPPPAAVPAPAATLPAEPPVQPPAPVHPAPAHGPAVAAVTPPPAPAIRKPAVPKGQMLVALVFDDMGVDRKRSAEVIALAGPLTLSFLPYAEKVGEQAAAGRARGHEIMLHLPMQPEGKADPGPHALTLAQGPDERLRRLGWNLDRFSGYVGVNNHMGSRFTADAQAMEPVLQALKARGVFFLDSRTSPHSVGLALALRDGLPAVGRDVFLDHEMAASAVDRRLADLEAVARRQGHAIAIGHPHDVTIAAVRRFIAEMPAKGLTLVPVSTLVRLASDG